MLPMQHVEKDMLYMKVADSIYNYIIDNDLQPGHKLPSEREMAKNLNIGRASLREAVRILEHEGILQVKVGIGTFVASTTENNSIYQKLFKGNYFDILDIRQVLEKEGIRRLISNCTDELLEEMEQTIVTMEDIASENIYPHSDDKYFHQMIFRSSNNKSLEKMASDLSNLLEEYSNVYPDASTCFIKTIPFHRALFEAVKKRNLADAFEAYEEIVSLDREILNMLVAE